MYPFTLGANIGTTITGILAAVVANTSDSMQVALAHFFFNIFGIIIWYPLPFTRRVPIRFAKGLGKATVWWRGFPILYIAICFFGIPLILLGLSALFTSGSKGLVVLGAILTIALGLLVVKFFWWWCRLDGRSKTELCLRRRQKRKDVLNDLVDEWEPLKDAVTALKDHTGYIDEGEDVEMDGKGVTKAEEPRSTDHTDDLDDQDDDANDDVETSVRDSGTVNADDPFKADKSWQA